jgi:hypothetical protein
MRRWLPLLLAACAGPVEAPRVTLPVVVDGAEMATAFETDLGYRVQIDAARLAFSGLVFTIAGEAHTASVGWPLWMPTALAHPGHFQGGEVTGELPGSFVVDWIADDGVELGAATLIAGTYQGANFTFDHPDALTGHSIQLEGTATRGDDVVSFGIVLDAPEDRQLIGAPFEADVAEDATAPVQLRMHLTDPFEGDTALDGVDFATLAADGALRIAPDVAEVEDPYNQIRRVLLTHDHYTATLQE